MPTHPTAAPPKTSNPCTLAQATPPHWLQPRFISPVHQPSSASPGSGASSSRQQHQARLQSRCIPGCSSTAAALCRSRRSGKHPRCGRPAVHTHASCQLAKATPHAGCHCCHCCCVHRQGPRPGRHCAAVCWSAAAGGTAPGPVGGRPRGDSWWVVTRRRQQDVCSNVMLGSGSSGAAAVGLQSRYIYMMITVAWGPVSCLEAHQHTGIDHNLRPSSSSSCSNTCSAHACNNQPIQLAVAIDCRS